MKVLYIMPKPFYLAWFYHLHIHFV